MKSTAAFIESLTPLLLPPASTHVALLLPLSKDHCATKVFLSNVFLSRTKQVAHTTRTSRAIPLSPGGRLPSTNKPSRQEHPQALQEERRRRRGAEPDHHHLPALPQRGAPGPRRPDARRAFHNRGGAPGRRDHRPLRCLGPKAADNQRAGLAQQPAPLPAVAAAPPPPPWSSLSGFLFFCFFVFSVPCYVAIVRTPSAGRGPTGMHL